MEDFSGFEFNKIKPLHNNVIILLPPDTGKLLHETKSGITISSALSGEELYSPCYGTIVKVSDSVDRRVKKGDQVFFHYLCYINARNTPKQYENGGYDGSKMLFIHNGNTYLTMGIDNCYFVKRGEDLVSINDFCLLRAVPLEGKTISVEHNGAKWNVFVSDSNGVLLPSIKEGYRKDIAEIISAPEDTGLVKGDIVAVPEEWDVPLEYDLLSVLQQQVFFLDKEYVCKIEKVA
jgi:co-chaperonin GroES (HSP10)